MIKKTFIVNNGYTIKSKETKYDLDTAPDVLINKNISDIASATIVKDGIILKRLRWICPYCNHQNKIAGYRGITIKEIDSRVFSQISLFDDEKTIHFISESDFNLLRLCNKCGEISVPASCKIKLNLIYDNNVVKISREIQDISQLLQVEWLDGEISDVLSPFPLYETINFDFNSGKAVFSIDDSKGVSVLYNDVYDGYKGIFELVLNKNTKIKKALIDILKEIWKPCSFPFMVDEITFNRLLVLVRFVGYSDRRFYDSIPVCINSTDLFGSFNKIADKLQNCKNVLEVYSKSLLPNFKSLKKLIFSNPELLFYIHEVEKLWLIFDDGNLLLSILKNERCHELLSYLHLYPCIFDFIKDFIGQKPKAVFMKKLIYNFYEVISYGLSYGSLRQEAKEYERTNWKKSKNYKWLAQFCIGDNPLPIPFSTPLKALSRDYECKIDGFNFIPLRSSKEYMCAGTELNNCLINWDNTNNPVVVVRQHDKPVAAIEIENGNRVVQAYAKNNEELSNYPRLHAAVLKYIKGNDLDCAL